MLPDRYTLRDTLLSAVGHGSVLLRRHGVHARLGLHPHLDLVLQAHDTDVKPMQPMHPDAVRGASHWH